MDLGQSYKACTHCLTGVLVRRVDPKIVVPSRHGPDCDHLKPPTSSYLRVHFGSKIFCILFSVLAFHPKMGLVWYHENQKGLKWKIGTESPDSNPLSASKMPPGFSHNRISPLFEHCINIVWQCITLCTLWVHFISVQNVRNETEPANPAIWPTSTVALGSTIFSHIRWYWLSHYIACQVGSGNDINTQWNCIQVQTFHLPKGTI